MNPGKRGWFSPELIPSKYNAKTEPLRPKSRREEHPTSSMNFNRSELRPGGATLSGPFDLYSKVLTGGQRPADVRRRVVSFVS